jgi:hypothetical protein
MTRIDTCAICGLEPHSVECPGLSILAKCVGQQVASTAAAALTDLSPAEAPCEPALSFSQVVGVPSLSSVRKAIHGTPAPAPELWGVWCELEDGHGEWWAFEGRRLYLSEAMAKIVAGELLSRNWTFSARPIPREEK